MKNKTINMLVKLAEKRLLPLTDKSFLKLKYYNSFNKKLDLKNPKTFNEKLQWIKLYDRNPVYSILVDKYAAKEYVKNIIGEEYIIPTIGIYDNWNEIDFNKLPNQFVIKCTHNSGGVIIVKDKKNHNFAESRKIIEKCLKMNFFYLAREWPYKNVKPRIIIEKYMSNGGKPINDYKFQMFNGNLGYSFTCTDRSSGLAKYTFFDTNKKIIDVTQCHHPNDKKNAKLPNNYEKMLELSKVLSKNIREIRVDFYEIDNKIYFGELTFFDSGGFGPFEPEEYDEIFGSMLNLDNS